MSKIRTEFQLQHSGQEPSSWRLTIRKQNTPHVAIWNLDESAPLFIPDEDLELVAVNILKALKSKYLKA